MKISKFFFSLFLVSIVLLLPVIGMAQPGDPGCSPDDPACPIDDGVILLFAAAIGIAAKRYFDSKKNKTFSAS